MSASLNPYMVPPQPPPLNIRQTHSPYGYPFPSPHPDSSPISTPYPPRPPPRPLPYQYRPHPADDGPSSSSSFPSRVDTPPGNASFSHPSGDPVMSGYAPSTLPSLHGVGIGYPPPLFPSPYGYSQQFLPHTSQLPIYQAYSPFQGHPATPRDNDSAFRQGSWHFVPHNHQINHYYEHARYHPPYQYLRQQPEFQVRPPPNTGGVTPMHHPGPPSMATPPASPSVSQGSSASSDPLPAGSKPAVRREWHPRPPAYKSRWVMWVGNVPSDASQEELWRFFDCGPLGGSSNAVHSSAGVESIFLIARSNCAFVNYISEASLHNAIRKFNGKRLRPYDPQCPMLVCKIRRSVDDLKSGVGGQRGMGLHKAWLQSQLAVAGDPSIPNPAVTSQLNADVEFFSASTDESIRGFKQNRGRKTSCNSHTSTTSSFLADHFPTRFFILKSLSEDDLNLSVENGLWATQKHNELLLDQAFRTAQEVFLIFSVNKSGEFFGYAKMVGPIRHGEGNVAWATRSSAGSSGSASSPSVLRRSALPADQLISPKDNAFGLIDGEKVIFESPAPLIQPHQESSQPPRSETPPPMLHHSSAPPRIGGEGPDCPVLPAMSKFSLDEIRPIQLLNQPGTRSFNLDEDAPRRARKDSLCAPGEPTDSKGKEKDTEPSLRLDELRVETEAIASLSESPPATAPGWGECFKVEWQERRKIPFSRTRHLRNPWNKGREIKISRDGTELEPTVGQRLLDEWPSLAEPSSNT